MADVDSFQDVLDSRDIIERIDELQGERDALVEAVDDTAEEYEDAQGERKDAAMRCNELAGSTDTGQATQALALAGTEEEEAYRAWRAAEDALEKWDEENKEELDALLALQEQCDYGDWKYGATLIRHTYFEDYCRELLEDVGTIPKDLPSWVAIDWGATSNNMAQDYTIVDFDGTDYFIRS